MSDIIVSVVIILVVAAVVFSPSLYMLMKYKRRQKQDAERADRKADLAVKKAKSKEKEAEDLRKAEESEKVSRKSKKAPLAAGIIPRDNGELISGPLTLFFSPGTQSSKILHLTNSLINYSNIQIASSGGAQGKGSWIGLYVDKPIPLYRVLYDISVVQQISHEGNKIRISMSKDE